VEAEKEGMATKASVATIQGAQTTLWKHSGNFQGTSREHRTEVRRRRRLGWVEAVEAEAKKGEGGGGVDAAAMEAQAVG
jgi:hypothetical protein